MKGKTSHGHKTQPPIIEVIFELQIQFINNENKNKNKNTIAELWRPM